MAACTPRGRGRGLACGGRRQQYAPPVPVEISFCVVNTEQRELLVRCLDAIAAEREALPYETEVLVLDNASHDGSAAAARNHALAPEVIALERRTGKGENDTALLKRARGRYAL